MLDGILPSASLSLAKVEAEDLVGLAALGGCIWALIILCLGEEAAGFPAPRDIHLSGRYYSNGSHARTVLFLEQDNPAGPAGKPVGMRNPRGLFGHGAPAFRGPSLALAQLFHLILGWAAWLALFSLPFRWAIWFVHVLQATGCEIDGVVRNLLEGFTIECSRG